MIFLAPLAWFALAAVVAPILVHLLAHRRAERVHFPTLRFIPATRLAAIRRRALDDVPLLAVRAAILAAAAFAFAGPLVITAGRRATWNGRLVRAIVVSPAVARTPVVQGSGVVAQDFGPAKDCVPPDCQLFEGDVRAGIRRTVTWLDSAPPGRREIEVVAPLTIGSLKDSDIAEVPRSIGIRFERDGTRTTSKTLSAAPLFTRTGVLQRTVTLEGGRTSVREEPSSAQSPNVSWPIEIAAPAGRQASVDAARAAVLTLRVGVPPPDHRVRLALAAGAHDATVASAAPVGMSWMADAVARIARNPALQIEAARTSTGLADPALVDPPWQRLAATSRGDALAVAATGPTSASGSSSVLLVAVPADASDVLIATVLRAVADALAPAADLTAAEILPIPDRQLRAWTREPGPAPGPRADTVDRDDRRWVWFGVLVLLAAESWMRRTRTERPAITEEETTARVA